MKSVFSFYLRYIIFILGVQMAFNILFLVLYQDLAKDVGISDQILALVWGMKLDVSLAAYILLFPTFMLVIFSIFRPGLLKKVIGIYTFLIFLCLAPAYITNLVTYKYWRSPIDRSIFDALSTPGEMFASVTSMELVLLIGTLILILYILYFRVYLRWVARPLDEKPGKSWIAALLFLLIFPSLIVPIRGGFSLAPIQTGSVFFHESTFINHAALNPVWNLFYTLVEGDKLTQSADFFADKESAVIMDKLYDREKTSVPVLKATRPNIILIILESFSQAVITELGGNGKAAPNFNGLVKEGLFFNKMYAAGTMTDRAIAAALAGYPGLPGICILHYESKTEKLPNLTRVLKNQGYSSAFLYGGDIDFAHIRSFLVIGGYEKIIEDQDFPRSIKRSNWGVPDHYLFQRLLEETDQANSPFFITLLTLSSHTPFDVPMEPVFEGHSELTKYYNSIFYTDTSLGGFIRTAKTREWWDQTLIILVADHGYRLNTMEAHEPLRYSIPMLWLGGALAISDTIISNYGSHIDLPATILNQVGLPDDDFKFSNDLLSPDGASFAFYAFNDGVGFLTDSSRTVYSTATSRHIISENSGSEKADDIPLAYLQFMYRDFNEK